MQQTTKAVVVSASKQWWLKINTKPVRFGPTDGAVFPYIIKAEYTVDGETYCKRKWIGAGLPVPSVGDTLTVAYCPQNPKKAKIL